MVIKSAKYVISSPTYKMCPPPDFPEFAFVGRSNVGKSSLINMLTGHHSLAKTSSSPGKTQLLNHFLINNNFFIVDMPGYGYAKVSHLQRGKWSVMVSDYLLKRPSLLHVFVLIDSRHEPQALDIDFVKQLHHHSIPFSLIFTKSDKQRPLALKTNVQSFLNEMQRTIKYQPSYFITSASKKTGRKDILKFMQQHLIESHQKPGEIPGFRGNL